MKLFTTSGSPYARKVRVVLAEKRIDCEIVMLAVLSDPDSPCPPTTLWARCRLWYWTTAADCTTPR